MRIKKPIEFSAADIDLLSECINKMNKIRSKASQELTDIANVLNFIGPCRKGDFIRIKGTKAVFIFEEYGVLLNTHIQGFRFDDLLKVVVFCDPYKTALWPDVDVGYFSYYLTLDQIEPIDKATADSWFLEEKTQREEERQRLLLVRKANAKQAKATRIYLMVDLNTGYWKIGRSNNPILREKTLQSEKPTIQLVFHFEGTLDNEKILHERFQKRHVRGEWFALTNQDIKDLRSEFKGAGLVEVLDQNQAKK